MRTIKMVADELGVTKQTIVNNAKSLNITFEKEWLFENYRKNY